MSATASRAQSAAITEAEMWRLSSPILDTFLLLTFQFRGGSPSWTDHREHERETPAGRRIADDENDPDAEE